LEAPRFCLECGINRTAAILFRGFKQKDRPKAASRLIDHATDIRLRAQIKAGELLREMAERKERHAGKAPKGLRVATPTPQPKLHFQNANTAARSGRGWRLNRGRYSPGSPNAK
jgi:hypothetical protein